MGSTDDDAEGKAKTNDGPDDIDSKHIATADSNFPEVNVTHPDRDSLDKSYPATNSMNTPNQDISVGYKTVQENYDLPPKS